MHSYKIESKAIAQVVKVLILVLMEDALVQILVYSTTSQSVKGLNPCFNGRCTRT